MFGKRLNILVSLVIGLAIFGLGFSLITNPLELLKQALLILVVVGLIFLLYKKFLVKKRGKEFTLYQKAAKQSARRYKQQVRRYKKRKMEPLIKKTKKREHNFTVIEGKKGKKNNRAL